jgi:mycothiol synthase
LISWQWRPACDTPEVAGLMARAAGADQEMGFSALGPAVSFPSARAMDLLAWTAARNGPAASQGRGAPTETQLAACLRLRLSTDGSGEASLVTDPDCRSLGIATTILEGIGRPSGPASGWPSPGLRRVSFWAAGSHPAADRLARRFGLPITAEVARLRRRLTAADSGPGPRPGSAGQHRITELAGRAADLSRLAVTELTGWQLATAGRRVPAGPDRLRTRVLLGQDGQPSGLARIRAAPATAAPPERTGLITAIADGGHAGALELLITDALRVLASMGQDHAEVALPAEQAELTALLRSLGFRHDQTDICYELS